MRRTTPDLSGSRQSVYRVVSISVLIGTVAYVLWTNYVIFVGGNLPLTSVSLGEGSTGAGLTMLFIGDLIVVLAVWFLVDGVLLNVLHMLLSRGGRPRSTRGRPIEQGSRPEQAQRQQTQRQQVPQEQVPAWQPGQAQQWEPQPWEQGQPGPGRSPQSQQAPWQQQPLQSQQSSQPQPSSQPQQWPPAPPADPRETPPGGASDGGSSQATLTAPQNGWSRPPER